MRWLMCLLVFAGAAAAATARSDSLQLGSLLVQRCAKRAPWCGTLQRPLDPRGVIRGQIPVYFEFYPHTAAVASVGTLVGAVGGPGYPTTGSRGNYLALFAPLRADHDVLLMDYRGTGRSAALDCEPLQHAPRLTEADIGACGRSLGAAAPLYSTALAADDLAALLDAAAIGHIDLYGDSYGTYFAQVFALRHPQRLRSLLLDGAYSLDGPDYPWYPNYAPAMRDKFNLACQRSAACQALAGTSLQHIAPALELLRRQPFSAAARADDGRLVHFTANASQLAIVMFGDSPDYATLRETDAAARAFSSGDQLPLLRLMAETQLSVDSRTATPAPRQFSAGLAVAVFCQDPPQIFDMALAPPQRLLARAAALARRRAQAPDTYAPFTIDEYRGMPIDYAYIDECVQWPAVPRDSPAVPLVPAGARYPDIPVLVISGEFDDITTVADSAAAAAHYPHAQHVIIANSFHVNALPGARSPCGARLAQHFIAALQPGDVSCAAAVPEVRLLPRFARGLHELGPARALAGSEASTEQLRAVSAALLTAEDVIDRAEANGAGSWVGLRGGSFRARPVAGGYRLTLRAVRWTEDCAFSGQIDWPGRSGTVRATLQMSGPQGARGALELQWAEGVSAARATVRGTLDGTAVIAEAPAP